MKYRASENPLKICAQCGKKTRRKRNKFCTTECYNVHRDEIKRRIATQSNCKNCGKECKWIFCTPSCTMIYRHAHKDEYSGYFAALAEGNASRKLPSDPCLQCGGSTPCHYNKYCSTECYVTYRKLHPEVYEESYQSMRESLRKLPDYVCKECGTIFRPTGKNRKFCDDDCFHTFQRKYPEEYAIDPEARRIGFEKFRSNTEVYAAWCRGISERMTPDHPIFSAESRKKSQISNKKYWDEHPAEKDARIKRFMQAPLRGKGMEWKPTSFEIKIMELNIPALSYLGDGSLFFTIGCSRSRKKNPDFLLRGTKKVVEVGDTEYWHTLE